MSRYLSFFLAIPFMKSIHPKFWNIVSLTNMWIKFCVVDICDRFWFWSRQQVWLFQELEQNFIQKLKTQARVKELEEKEQLVRYHSSR